MTSMQNAKVSAFFLYFKNDYSVGRIENKALYQDYKQHTYLWFNIYNQNKDTIAAG